MNVIKELWHGNICPQTDSRNNSPEMKDLMEYMARHYDDLLKTMTDEQRYLRSSPIVGVNMQATQNKPSSHTLSSSVCRLLLKH